MSWSVTLTTKSGTVLAQCPEFTLGPVSEPFTDTEDWSVTFPPGSAAAKAVLTADPLPEVECMVKRGTRVVAWGPCVDVEAAPEGGVRVQCRGATQHLDRTLIGPAAMDNEHTDPDFDNGLTDWDEYRTDLVIVGDDVFPTFVAVDGIITVETTGVGIPDPPVAGQRMVRFRGDLMDADQGCQIAEDFTITPSAYRDLNVTARAAFYVPSATPFVRTNIDGCIYVSRHATDASFPDAYFAPVDIAVEPWPEIPIQGTWFDAEATLTIPAGSGSWVIHAAYSPPQMDCFVTLPEFIIDEAIEVVDSTGPDVVDDLVAHAQSSTYGHVDRNLSVTETAGGPRVDRFYPWASHQAVGSAIRDLVDQGLVEWRMSYTPTTRAMVAAATVGSKVAAARVVATTEGNPGSVRVVGWSGRWSSGSDVVTAQSGAGGAERSATAGIGLGWEEIVPAPDWVPRWQLPEWATSKVSETSTPQTVDVEWPPGSVWATGDARVGDSVDAVFDLAGVVRVSGEWRAVQVEFDPGSDRARVTFAPTSVAVSAL